MAGSGKAMGLGRRTEAWATLSLLVAPSAGQFRHGRSFMRLPSSPGDDRALDQFHDQRTDATGVFEAVDRGDVGVVQQGEDLRIAAEPREAIQIVHDGGRQDFGRASRLSLALRARYNREKGALQQTYAQPSERNASCGWRRLAAHAMPSRLITTETVPERYSFLGGGPRARRPVYARPLPDGVSDQAARG